ncbi:MAG TPA: alcohol dehydrogenase catalytic domain-containing protein [Mycobacterium sp.]
MHKVQITAIGEPADVLQLVELQTPAPGPGQVLVEMEAATVNASDFLYISGQYCIAPSPPSDVGGEGVGRVVAVRLCSSRITPPKPEASTNAPCSKTTVGVDVPAIGCLPFLNDPMTYSPAERKAASAINVACSDPAGDHQFM